MKNMHDARRKKIILILYADNEGLDQTAHSSSLMAHIADSINTVDFPYPIVQ